MENSRITDKGVALLKGSATPYICLYHRKEIFMIQEPLNALLSPMEVEDFQNTVLYSLLSTQKELWAVISGFLSDSSQNDLEYTINPLFGYASYEQEDFDEICGYFRYCGEQPLEDLIFKQTFQQYADLFSLVHTAVGDYVVCDMEKNIQGILNGK